MTNGEIVECVAAVTEYNAALRAYRDSCEAIGRYMKADADLRLRRLLWVHGPALIELADLARVAQ